MLLNVAYAIVAFWLLFLTARAWVSVRRSRKWCEEQIDAGFGPRSNSPAIFLLIPVLREQHQIKAAIDHFSKLSDNSSALFRVVFISTEREDADRDRAHDNCEEIFEKLRSGQSPTVLLREYPALGPRSLVVPVLERRFSSPTELLKALKQIPTTRQVVEHEISCFKKNANRILIRSIHYPYANQNAYMAHQVNYGIRYLFEVSDSGIVPDQTFVALYNADSRPDLRTMRAFEGLISRQPSLVVAQQYAIYTAGNLNPILNAAAIWQTRWSLAVEFRRALAQVAYSETPMRQWAAALKRPFAYPIGHGFFARLDFLIRSNYLPQTVPSEDQCFGYLLGLEGVEICPLPVFDHSLVPPDLHQLSGQQSSWFLGPAQAFDYLRLARARTLNKYGETFALVFALKVLFDAVAWVVGPLLFLIFLIVFAITLDPKVMMLLLLYLVYLIAPSLSPMMMVKEKQGSSLPRQFLALTLMPIFFLIHGLSPLRTVSIIFRSKECRGFEKPKTDH